MRRLDVEVSSGHRDGRIGEHKGDAVELNVTVIRARTKPRTEDHFAEPERLVVRIGVTGGTIAHPGDAVAIAGGLQDVHRGVNHGRVAASGVRPPAPGGAQADGPDAGFTGWPGGVHTVDGNARPVLLKGQDGVKYQGHVSFSIAYFQTTCGLEGAGLRLPVGPEFRAGQQSQRRLHLQEIWTFRCMGRPRDGGWEQRLRHLRRLRQDQQVLQAAGRADDLFGQAGVTPIASVM